MSRVAKAAITIPQGVEVAIGQDSINVKGALGALILPLNPRVKVVQDGGKLTFAPTDDTRGNDRLIGQGSITFPSSGGSVGIYSSDAAMRRLASARASGGSVSLRATRTGADLVAIEDGDWSFAILSATTGFFMASASGGTGAWEINDVRTACGPFSGTAGGIAGDVDKVSLDGACPVRLTLYNPGPANVTLTYQAAGQAVVTETVAPSTAPSTIKDPAAICTCRCSSSGCEASATTGRPAFFQASSPPSSAS